MRKFLNGALLALLALCLLGCDQQTSTVPSATLAAGVYMFEGEVVEVGENTVTVMPDQNYKEFDIAMDIGLVIVKTEKIPDVKAGQRVRIEYDGAVTRSIPGQLVTVYKFEIIA